MGDDLLSIGLYNCRHFSALHLVWGLKNDQSMVCVQCNPFGILFVIKMLRMSGFLRIEFGL